MPVRSAGLLVHRRDAGGRLEVLLVHPGGPYWANKDDHAWSIPKGEYDEDEVPLDVARREFEEELGMPPPEGTLIDLGEVTQSGGKLVRAWAVEGDIDASTVTSNTFEMEWPPRSGRTRAFPEVDRADWFDLDTARRRIHTGQAGLLDALAELLTDE